MAALALAALGAAALAATAGAGSSAVSGSQAVVSCKSPVKIALATPLTGGGGFIGSEQLSWGKFGVKTLSKKYGLKVTLVSVDTPIEKGGGEAQTVSQKLISDPKVLAVMVATSGGVASSTTAFTAAGIAQISPSATRTSLTKGANKEATSSFFRVVPGDYIQGPTDANYMVDKLKAKKVAIIDFQEPYSVGLGDAAEIVLKKRGVSVTRQSTSVTTTDFSSLVTRVPNDADVVFFPSQQAADAQTFAQQLLEQGKKAKVFGGDGTNSPTDFHVAGSYVSNFAPDISGIASSKALIAGWQKDNPKAKLGSFGPPDLPRGRGRAQRDQEDLRRRSRPDQEPQGHHQERQEDQPQDVDPRRSVPLLDEVERPAEREVLRLPDPVERHVQAGRLSSSATDAARLEPGRVRRIKPL